ncbi:hypothetical protein AVEN_834-1 [Araneus ventricosus]|uniref:Transposable element Tc3 transposase n=1 Tax=Araneus ventricosus TaxID=182803 RepID=A0A4Y2GHU0_ARAVE|nr:hypothetical protein AVEN_834-1 [Araneus ventricosus]
MQDGAPPHIANLVNELLTMHFVNDRINSRHFPTNWTPRSPDLDPWDFWRWGYLKHVVLSGPIANLAELKTRISTDTLPSVVEHAKSQFELVAENSGQLIEHILKKTRDSYKAISLLLFLRFLAPGQLKNGFHRCFF